MNAKRRQYSADERRQMAVSAAEILLIEKGMEGMSMRVVAQQIGCAVSLLYKLFKDQDALLLGVSERTAALLLDALERAASRETRPSRKIRAVAHAYIEFALANPNRWRLMFTHRIGPDSIVPESNQLRAEKLFRFVEGLLADYAPQLARGDLRVTATALWAGIHGIAALAVDDKLSWSDRDDPLLIADRMLRGYVEFGPLKTSQDQPGHE